jgi:hypothetical protein
MFTVMYLEVESVSQHPYEMIKEQIQPVLQSKLDEFWMMGYTHFHMEDLWEYLLQKKWRKVDPEIRIHRIVQDVFAIRIFDVLDFKSIQALRSNEMDLSEDADWRKLLK